MQNIFRKYTIAAAAAVIALLSLAGCGGNNEWTVGGRIEGADGQTMLLEASDNGRWYPIDSVTLDASGNFSMSHAPVGYPDIFRLRLGNKTLYFPIDSIESVTVISNAAAFDTEYTLEGSPSAEKLMAVDHKLMDVVSRKGVGAISSDSLLKRELGGIILSDETGVVSYYIISKRIGGVPVFDPANKSDLRIIGAVANAFTTYRPNDPRTAYISKLYLSNRANNITLPSDTLRAPEISIFDISLLDDRGKQQSLKSLIDSGKFVVLDFTVYGAEGSPAYNRQLNSIYQKYAAQGLEIFQVGLDQDEYTWRQSARNLPWITVYNSPASGSRNLLNYNVIDIPVSFIINRNGDIVERVEDIKDLDRLVAKHI